MKAIAYNYLGEVVHENDDGTRLHGRNSARLQMERTESSAKVLRITPTDRESSWLCAIAFVSQNRSTPIQIAEFFRLTTAHLPAAVRKDLIEFFVIDCLHAFYRMRKGSLETIPEAPSFSTLIDEFESLGFPKALQKIMALKDLADPASVAALRAAHRRGSLPAIRMAVFFDPLDDGATEFSSQSDRKPWSIDPSSNLIGHHAPALPSIRTIEIEKIIHDGKTGSIHFRGALSTLPFNLSEDLSCLKAQAISPNALDRQAYPPVSSKTEAASSLSTTLMLAHKKMKQALSTPESEWLHFVGNLINLPIDEMTCRLSAEQIDATGIAAHNFSARKSFILADETGLGKGRTLAALAKAFLHAGKRVVFITEKRHLFSDFWRDLVDVYGPLAPPPTPFLLHPQGRVIARDGAIIAKSPSATKYKELLATQTSPSPIVFTTYSQFNRDAKLGDKHQLLEKHLDGALLILDESHNAAGDSQTRKNILSLIAAAAKCVFSSATYAKHEMAFELYESATPLTKNEMALLLSSYGSIDPHATSNALAAGLVSIGSMVRREHTPDAAQESVIILPSAEQQQKLTPMRDKLQSCLSALFELQTQVDIIKREDGEDTEASWMKLGGTLSRLCKQFNLLSKIDIAIDETAKCLELDKKVVIALESTFESFINAQLSWNQKHKLHADWLAEEDQDEDGSVARLIISDDSFSFASLFKLIVESIAPTEPMGRYKSIAVQDAKSKLLMLADDLPNWLASPLDLLRMEMERRGFRVGEISGRSKRIQSLSDGTYELIAGEADQREAIVKKFNDGETDVLILTQAGASGISLHASSTFKDQRTRVFMELEVCTNPAQRLQFLGRVRRKGQVRPPEYCMVSSGSPYEHRLLERAISKQALMSGLTSGTQELASGALNLGTKILTAKGDRIAREWLAGHRDECKRLGIFLPPAENTGLAEKLLKRVALLPAEQQNDVFSFLSKAIEIDSIIPLSANPRPYHQNALLVRSRAIWGPSTPLAANAEPSQFTSTVQAQEWICLPKAGNFGSKGITAALDLARGSAWRTNLDSLGRAIQKISGHAHGNYFAALRLHDMRNLAPHLEPGSKLRMSHPSTGRPMDGIVIGITPPERSDWLLYPSQWSLRTAFPSQNFEVSISLTSFFNDPNAYLSKSIPPPSHLWDSAKDRTHHFTTIDGHCGYSRWYATLVGAKHTVKFLDANQIPRELNALPFETTIEDILGWKIPLIDPRLTLQILQRDTQLALDDAILPHATPQLTISPTGGGWNLVFRKPLHDAVVDFNLERRLGARKYLADEHGDKILRFVSSQNIHAVIGLLHTRNCRFALPPSRGKWHANALELLLATGRKTKQKRRH